MKSESDLFYSDENYFKPKSKNEVLKIIDIAEMQFRNGEFTDSEVMEKELAEEFNLKTQA